MRIVTKRRLREFWEIHRDCEQQLLSWYRTASRANWKTFDEVKYQFGTCKAVGHDRLIFKIKGNNHRLVVKATFTNQIIWILFIGTHDGYNKIDAKTI